MLNKRSDGLEALLFDLGGTFLRAGILSPDGALLRQERSRIPNLASGDDEETVWSQVLDRIIQYVRDQDAHVSCRAPVVISFPGPITLCRRPLQAPTVIGRSTKVFDLVPCIEATTSRRVFVLNDVSAAAWRLAEIRSERRFLVVTVSSGIGSKIYDRCHASGVLDQPPFSGEIGHLVVDDSHTAPVCDCGGRGHLGAIASGRAIEREARIAAMRDQDDFLRSKVVCEFGASVHELTNEEHLVPAILAGDRWATQLLRKGTQPLVKTLMTVAYAAGLERIFIIGGFAQALGSVYVQTLRELAKPISDYDLFRDNSGSLFELVAPKSEMSLEGCGAFLRHQGEFA